MRDITRPEVWAPSANCVDLALADAIQPMTPTGDGWWRAESLPPGTRYGFVLDGGAPLPDPRSLAQPDGVHGLSQIVDPAALHTKTTWLGRDVRGTVLYELHIGTFTAEGTFDAAIDRLGHLVELGVQTVEIMPVAPFPGDRGWGYDGVGLYGVHPVYGGPEAFARFVTAAHEVGIAVVLDVVYNHLGPEGNYLAQFGPYFTDAHHTPWGDAVNLDAAGSREVRNFLLGAARQWLVDFRLDGLRLDAVHALCDTSDEHFLAELALANQGWAAEVGRPLTLIAESDLNQPSMVSPVGSSDDACGMEAQWADDVHHALHSFLTGEQQGYYVDFGSADVLAKALTQVFVHDGEHSTFRGKDWGAPVDPTSTDYDGHSFVVFLQNHDQVGNRAVGDRIGHELSPGLQAAGAALYLLSAYTPQIFMGEEWDATTPFPYFSSLGGELGPMVSQGRAREFAAMEWAAQVPDPEAATTRESAVLNWDERSAEAHARMLAWYRRLIELRSKPDFANASLTSTTVQVIDKDSVMMLRGELAVVVTRTAQPLTLDLDVAEVLASWDEVVADAGRLTIPGPGVAVVRRR